MSAVILRGSRKRVYWRSYSVRLPVGEDGGCYGGGIIYFRKEHSSSVDFFARLPNANIEDLSEKSIDAVVEKCLDGKSGLKVLPEGRKLLPSKGYAAYY
ncbi:MAG: hypothetical protein KAV87_53310 [Desulfobacteraceae bacterium]|nr:hypothetical protein [Desulfobacteraceae bacterium]